MSVNLRLIKLICAGMFATLGACGGAPGTNPNLGGGSGSGGSGGATSRDITVSVSGASGEVVLNVGDQTLTFSDDGEQVLEDVSFSSEVVASFNTVPVGDICVFLPSSLSQITVGNQVTVACGDPAVSGEIRDFILDTPVPTVDVTVTHEVGGADVELESFTTPASGAYEVSSVSVGDRLVISTEVDGYSPYSSIATATTQRPFVTQNIFLTSVTETQTVSPGAEMNFFLNLVPVLSIPANGLETEGGAAPTGQVTASITLLDGSSEPRSLPGRYEIEGGGYLESYGAISIVLRDESDNKLRLAPGVNATLAVPIALEAASASPELSSVFGFDSAGGVWTSLTAANKSFLGITRFYEATINELFDSYSVGDSYSVSQISGCLEDNDGNRIAGAPVIVEGSNYIGLTFGLTDANGNFLVDAKASSSVFVYGLLNTRGQTQTVSTPSTGNVEVLSECNLLDDSTTVITLTWGENPRDLDSQFFGPDGNERFRIYYVDRTVTVNGVEMFLDVDDVSGFGPEVTTIPQFPSPGTYEFFVDLFSGEGTIANSPARVEVNVQGNSFVFSPEGGTPTDCWHVFDITVDQGLNGTVVPRGNWVSDTACTNGLQ